MSNLDWINEKGKDMILGNDLDSIISGCFLHNYMDWNIKGFYCHFNKIYFEKNSNPKESVFVDLDISSNKIKSIGHHILQKNKKDNLIDIGHEKSINPNLERKITLNNYTNKYPLGTIHYLMKIYNIEFSINKDEEKLIWLCDSSHICAQKYEENFYNWIDYLNIKNLREDSKNLKEKDFEEMISKVIYPKLQKIGFKTDTGKHTTKHLNIPSMRCYFSSPYDHLLPNLINLICEIYKWKKPSLPNNYIIKNLRRNQVDINSIYNLKEFIKTNKIFSYAIINKKKLDYTIQISKT